MWRRGFPVALAAAVVSVCIGAGAAGAAFPGDNGGIAFERYLPGGSHVFTVEPGKDPRDVSAGRAPAWSSDGTKLAILALSTQHAFQYTIHVVKADGTGRVEVGPQLPPTVGGRDYSYSTFVANPAWSPDGRSIAYHRHEVACGGHSCVQFDEGIWTINVDGSGERQLTLQGDNPAWS